MTDEQTHEAARQWLSGAKARLASLISEHPITPLLTSIVGVLAEFEGQMASGRMHGGTARMLVASIGEQIRQSRRAEVESAAFVGAGGGVITPPIILLPQIEHILDGTFVCVTPHISEEHRGTEAEGEGPSGPIQTARGGDDPRFARERSCIDYPTYVIEWPPTWQLVSGPYMTQGECLAGCGLIA